MNASIGGTHRRRIKAATRDQGIDLPPSIVGYNHGNFVDLPIEMQTLHHLCTMTTETEGTSICRPEILFERFIVLISFSGKLKLYEVKSHFCNQVPLCQIKPKWVCEVLPKDDSFTRVTVIASCRASYKIKDGLLGYVVVATSQQEIFLVRIMEDDKPSVEYSFSTGILNTFCITCWFTDEGFLHFVIGSKSGFLEEWNININLSGCQETILWKGSFGTTLNSVLAVHQKTKTTLSVCISQKPYFGRALQSSTVEVLNRQRLIREYKAENGLLKLIDYCLWPEAGYEWRQISDCDVSNGEGVAFGSNIMCCVDETRWAAALADGSVGILHTGGGDAINWGIKRDSHQATLTYPAIGISIVNLSNKPHLVCCLRGGTIYCLSVKTDEEDESNLSTVFLPPFTTNNGDDFEFLHGFAAGNISMTGEKVSYGGLSTDNMPIVVYSGDGGVMEVYACGLLTERSKLEVAQELVLKEMRDNGTVQMLLDALQNMKEDNPLLLQTIWSLANNECTVDCKISIDDIITNASKNYENTRSLLISLAT
mmetsp:Transcript_13091/g.19268  ORF Transcript_13091/g.19268 Transcript_13091/m.19268 type:complete len:539 (+) Transcript_13091:51-1667(+)